MSVQMIPLTNKPNQTFAVLLTIDKAPLTLNVRVYYNEMAGCWMLAISNTNNQLLIDSVPMLCGGFPAANLLMQQRYLNIGSWYVINVANLYPSAGLGYGQGGFGGGAYGGGSGQGGEDYPDISNLGTDFQLWIDDTPPV